MRARKIGDNLYKIFIILDLGSIISNKDGYTAVEVV